MTPDDFTNQELMLEVGDGHTLYVHDWGAADAKVPILFLHGGPGGGCNDGQKGYFEPSRHRVIFYDQRGAGKSLPYGSLQHNTTQDLVADIDKILDHFQLEQVVLCGRSWGSSLALCYALQQPSKVRALIIGGVFLADNAAEAIIEERVEVAKLLYPDVWDNPELPANQLDLWQAALDPDAETAKRAAYQLARIVLPTMRLDDRQRPIDYETFDPTSLTIEAHYKTNDWFLPAGHILDHVNKLTMPVWLIQGRYDVVCLPKFAYDLHQRLPDSHLIWTQAGHSGGDRENWLATRSVLSQFV